ncbi:hypothetical protein [Flavobacterium piscinae]|nr:hypothetical protein [Flavobacterium piscinae]
MHNLFFGGMSQYYYNGTTLVQDNLVPFVKTISRVTREANGNLTEYKLPVEMPLLNGAGAEFIPNLSLPRFSNEVIKLDDIVDDEFIIGHLVGGISSSSLNPFSVNQTNTTSANPTVYEVKLIKEPSMSIPVQNSQNPISFTIAPNPIKGSELEMEFEVPYEADLSYFITSLDGKILSEGEITDFHSGKNTMQFVLPQKMTATFILTLVFDNKFYSSQKIMVE